MMAKIIEHKAPWWWDVEQTCPICGSRFEVGHGDLVFHDVDEGDIGDFLAECPVCRIDVKLKRP